MAVAAALLVAAAVLLWPTVVKPRVVASETSPLAESESSPDHDEGLASATPPKPPILAPVAGARHGVAGAVAPRDAAPVTATREVPSLVAAILEPPQPPRPPPPPKPAEVAIEQRLSAAIGQNRGTELKFVACDEDGAPCRARLQARELETVAAAAREASVRYGGHVDIKLHEQLSASSGRFFVAELQIGTKEPRPVPTDIEP